MVRDAAKWERLWSIDLLSSFPRGKKSSLFINAAPDNFDEFKLSPDSEVRLMSSCSSLAPNIGCNRTQLPMSLEINKQPMNICRTSVLLRDLRKIPSFRPTFIPIISCQVQKRPLQSSIPRNRNMAKTHTPIPSLKLNDGTSIPMVSLPVIERFYFEVLES